MSPLDTITWVSPWFWDIMAELALLTGILAKLVSETGQANFGMWARKLANSVFRVKHSIDFGYAGFHKSGQASFILEHPYQQALASALQ